MHWPSGSASGLDPDLDAHVEDSIRSSPCTFVELAHGDVAAMAQEHGLDARTRIAKFALLDHNAKTRFFHAFNKCQLDPKLGLLIARAYGEMGMIPRYDAPKINRVLNSLFHECGLCDEVQMCESVAAAYGASVAYEWFTADVLNRMIKGSSELDSMLLSMQFGSNLRKYVSLSLTRSPFLLSRDVEYTIRITDAYRRRISTLAHTAVFESEFPETQKGLKNTYFLEDEVRMKNKTPIEDNTVTMVFYYEHLPKKSTIDALEEKYAPLGSVNVSLKKGRLWNSV